MDEFALPPGLKGVYRAKQGRVAVDAGAGGTLAGRYFAGLPAIREVTRRRRAARAKRQRKTWPRQA